MVLFLITGGVYYGVAHTSAAPVTVVCVAICHFFFNFGTFTLYSPLALVSKLSAKLTLGISTGANSLTFIIPAEIFPTTYRCTCHGISAAAGKIGSMVAIVVVYGINSGYKSSTRQGLEFLLFSFFMLLGAVYSWAYLPNLQRWVIPPDGAGKPRLETKNLEDLGEGRERARRDGEVVTVREKVEEIKRRRRRREMPVYAADGARNYSVQGQDIGMR